MKDFFKELFDYTHRYNLELATVFTHRADKTSEKAIQLFSHMLNAHHVWNNRIDLKQPAYGIWQVHPVNEFESIAQTNYKQSMAILDKHDLNETIHYSNSKGQPFNNTARDILFQVINHSTYHRGQIATEFKLHGIDPLMTDYIFYKR